MIKPLTQGFEPVFIHQYWTFLFVDSDQSFVIRSAQVTVLLITSKKRVLAYGFIVLLTPQYLKQQYLNCV
jgi:hypothetical protein